MLIIITFQIYSNRVLLILVRNRSLTTAILASLALGILRITLILRLRIIIRIILLILIGPPITSLITCSIITVITVITSPATKIPMLKPHTLITLSIIITTVTSITLVMAIIPLTVKWVIIIGHRIRADMFLNINYLTKDIK